MTTSTQDTILKGALWGGLAFVFEYPLEVAKYVAQGRPHLSQTQALQRYFNRKGFSGFYDGGVYGLATRVIRGTYRWPAVCSTQDFWDETLPADLRLKSLATAVAAGGIITCGEVGAILPAQKMMVSKINGLGLGALINYPFKYEGIRSLYHGATPMFCNYWFSWSSYLLSDRFAKKVVKRHDPQNTHPTSNKVKRSLIVAAGMTIPLPLEFILYQIQIEPQYQNKPTLKVIAELYAKHGIRGFYSGLPAAFAQRSLQGFFGSLFFEKVLKRD